jgi:hypothetical protein
MNSQLGPLPCLFFLAFPGLAQQPVEIRVDGGATQGAFRPLYACFGHDEPNYTYTANGMKLVGELAALIPVRVQIRAHHLLVTGDGAAAPVRLTFAAVPNASGRVLVEHFRIDGGHSNSYTLWKRMGSPAQRSPEQYARMEAAGQLQLLRSPEWRAVKDGRVAIEFQLRRQAVSLVRVSW